MTRTTILLLLALLPAAPCSAQVGSDAHGWDALRITKWAAFAGTAAVAVYGVSSGQSADQAYERLERACSADPGNCLRRGPDGSYLDQELERQYQGVRRQDRRARNALLASQAGLVASIVLFVLDLRHAQSPADIPYDPERFRIGTRSDGALEFAIRF